MTIWIDAQLSPFIANWINANFPELDAKSLRSLGLEYADDYDIFQKARKANVVVMSKDYDFVKLIEIHGVPPQLIWVTCGNTSNIRLCDILNTYLQQAVNLLNQESIVEISDKFS
jgi:predicted nuclease of predicted toxin-antitoxin system